MPGSMIVHDSRLRGRPPEIAPNTYTVNSGTSIQGAFRWIATYARRQGGLDNLYILAHGIEGGVHDSIQQVSTYALGFGLLLCSENLTLQNVSITQGLFNLVSTITLYSCGPGNTREGFEGTQADGRRFCSEMAAWTGGEVIAAVETQIYHVRQSVWDALLGREGVMDFGAWEGPVYRFGPDGSMRRMH
jgi:hypothetical protein